ncbi:bifunctional diaminohydroxyphosphoribosylaminopyrimidine deaminase/5-amino-6-(5-phosphoribosylamino)uracil reductase RibD [Acetobacter estunensis]|uniref:bifunctional diaminohydroxyphosphoribosylaminopyrimidine deaminase/5-amino-6-(5-phosphoribosylamino)uracil reductase RibD n=1 Tax=Acetobacter estunensis TaxID=104097 RepID=UPI001C2CF237|nr:bifunctional diaminohydroxyphosphoribosylaminopyrimidine deaminase/5-amino-6-(5-phosphoribosylamino)uracil reductase RibD [Acetobacter estunensis]MBV1837565.1 bifunctional diaminohydroxyphosphoribosylaminopyrimidine deaminase/5-amino-6-(5-phosphoribosylamino)uracil reductase RibD [Acetobacter estunensis]
MAGRSEYQQISEAFHAAVGEACRFVGATAPNPPVGCALLDADGQILAVAAHHRAGTFHAEARALHECAQRGLTDRIVTAIVTLEPCNHTGRTPPCAEALLATPVKTVWIACADPNPQVTGGGAARLEAAGRAVRWLAREHTHLPDGEHLLAQCRGLIAPFIRWSTQGRTWLTVKQAVDERGGMIPPVGRTTFTSPVALDLAHRLRRATDAVVTAGGTVRADLPGLNVRRVSDHAERRKRVLAVCSRTQKVPSAWLEQAEKTFDVIFLNDVRDIPQRLAEVGALWALVEAGPELLATLREQDVWDDWLTIGVQPDGSERFSVEQRHADTPLTLFGELAGAHAPVAPVLV